MSGLTLIEVLIALLVLSIGLAGIAVLHINSIKFAHSSYYTSIASSVALDLEERLWLELSRDGGTCLSGDQVDEVLSDIEDLWGGGVVPAQGVPIMIPGLSVDRGDLGSGSGSSSWIEVPITISWTEGRFSEGSETEQFFYTTRVVCFEPDA